MYINEDFSIQRGKHKNVSRFPYSSSSFATIAYSVNVEDACEQIHVSSLCLSQPALSIF